MLLLTFFSKTLCLRILSEEEIADPLDLECFKKDSDSEGESSKTYVEDLQVKDQQMNQLKADNSALHLDNNTVKECSFNMQRKIYQEFDVTALGKIFLTIAHIKCKMTKLIHQIHQQNLNSVHTKFILLNFGLHVFKSRKFININFIFQNAKFF